MLPPVALTIAGSDPSGGAGIQADLKTFHQFGVYGEAVITLLTVQNTRGVSRVEVISPDLIREQIEAVLADIPPGAAKTGALGNVAAIEVVVKLARTFQFPLVVDPVMISKHGMRLLSEDAESAVVRSLLPHATIVTPNIPEAERLTGMAITTVEDMRTAARSLREKGCRAVLIKGGHKAGEPVDVLSFGDQSVCLPGVRVASQHTHGTGCTYAAAITANLACGHSLVDSVRRGKQFIQAAIETAPGLGAGQGPINHFASVGAEW